MKVHFRIKRCNPERDSKSYWGDYDVDADPLDRVLDGLHQIKWYIDGTLALRRSCAHGIRGAGTTAVYRPTPPARPTAPARGPGRGGSGSRGAIQDVKRALIGRL